MFYQIKMIRKKTKPPIWRRAYVPSDITFTQLALILEELLEFSKTDLYEFEFYQAKARITEWHEEDSRVADYQFDKLNAPDTFINKWFENEKWFTFRIRSRNADTSDDLPEYRVEIEKAFDRVTQTEDGKPLDYPILVRELSRVNDEFWKNGANINSLMKDRCFLKERDTDYPYFSEVRNCMLLSRL